MSLLHPCIVPDWYSWRKGSQQIFHCEIVFFQHYAEAQSMTTQQRSWVRKTASVLDKLPEINLVQAKKMFHNIQSSDHKSDAIRFRDEFSELFNAQYPKAVLKWKQ